MNQIIFDVNNGGEVVLSQFSRNGNVQVSHHDSAGNIRADSITEGDFVMLINLYRYVKDNDIQNDFINPNGKNKDE